MKRVGAVLLVVALTCSASLAKPPKLAKPPTAKFTLDETSGDSSGSFRINKRKRFTKLKLTPAGKTAKKCGTRTIRFNGKRKLGIATRGGFSTWIVGRNTPETPDGVSQVKLAFEVKGNPFKAMFKITFHYRDFKKGTGQFNFGNCQIEFDFLKAE